MKNIDIKKLLLTTLGILIMGVGCGLLIKSGYGADTSNALFTGISKVSGINAGNVNSIMAVIFVIIIFILSKKRIGIGTLLVPVFVSFPINFAISIFKTSPNIYIGVIVDLIALFVVSIGAALTIITDLGASPFDALALAISDFFKIKFVYAKYMLDGVCVFVGYLLGGEVGIGTLLCFLVMGNFIDINVKLFKKLLKY